MPCPHPAGGMGLVLLLGDHTMNCNSPEFSCMTFSFTSVKCSVNGGRRGVCAWCVCVCTQRSSAKIKLEHRELSGKRAAGGKSLNPQSPLAMAPCSGVCWPIILHSSVQKCCLASGFEADQLPCRGLCLQKVVSFYP